MGPSDSKSECDSGYHPKAPTLCFVSDHICLSLGDPAVQKTAPFSGIIKHRIDSHNSSNSEAWTRLIGFSAPSTSPDKFSRRRSTMEGEKEPAEGISIGCSYSVLFGISCACVAIDLMARRSRVLDIEKGRRRTSSAAEAMLKASAQLLGLVVLDRAQRRGEALEGELKKAEMKIEELKMRRTEDAKANEKVVGIFAAHEQRWIAERKCLRMQVRALANEARVAKAKHEEAVSSLSKRLEDDERLVLLKEEALEEETRKRKELEEKLQAAEDATEELREKTKKEAQDHAAELWKHKTGLVELASSQRRTEAELGRALGQAALVKQELHEALARKQEALALVEKLSAEVVKTQKDSEQKDRILSAMLRKSKLDSAEKQMLMKEVKAAKARKKQAEVEAERCRNMSRHRKSSSGLHSAEPGDFHGHERMELQLNSNRYYQGKSTLVVDHLEAEGRKKGHDASVPCPDQYSSDENGDSGNSLDEYFPQLGDWVRTEFDKCEGMIKQKHNAEIEAFTEQMRQKDEKLEACRWQIQSMELESKRLQSHIQGLDGKLNHFMEENIKLEALLSNKERELQSLKEQLNLHVQKSHECKASQVQAHSHEVRISRRKSGLVRDAQMTKKLATKLDVRNTRKDATSSLFMLESNKERDMICRESKSTDTKTSSSTGSSSPDKKFQDIPDACSTTFSPAQPKTTKSAFGQQVQNKHLESNYANGDAEEEKEVKMDQASAHKHSGFREDADVADKSPSFKSQLMRKGSSWKMDIHALAVSYKIKRIKQQLHALENLVVSQKTKMLQLATEDVPSSAPDGSVDRCDQTKGLHLMRSLLTKQLKRYQSLEEKTDDLCRRVQDSYPSGSRRELRNGRTKEQTTTLELLLEETFHLQRVVVATGQKPTEIQSRIASSISFAMQLELTGFNMEQFLDVVRSLFREIQRGLEVRIARIIGDLEGTLACDGILHR